MLSLKCVLPLNNAKPLNMGAGGGAFKVQNAVLANTALCESVAGRSLGLGVIYKEL